MTMLTGHENEGSWNKQSGLQAASLMNTTDAWMGYPDDKLTGNLNRNSEEGNPAIEHRVTAQVGFRTTKKLRITGACSGYI